MNKYMLLPNGVKMPMIGFGTYPMLNEDLYKILPIAYSLGFNRFDTAWYYKNESVLGSFIEDNNIDRKNIFITSKVNFYDIYNVVDEKVVKKSSLIDEYYKSCSKLKTNYVDLLLIHWPWFNSCEMWEEMELLYKEKKVRAIGVSSFEPSHLDELICKSEISPMVNQFEISPYNTRKYLIDYCNKKKIVSEAFSLFNVGRSYKGVPPIMYDRVLQTIAKKKGVTVAQIVIKWAINQGLCMSIRSINRKHLLEDLKCYGIIIGSEDMKYIDSLNQDKFVYANKQKLDISYIKQFNKKSIL